MNPPDELRSRVEARVYDMYCDCATRSELIRQGNTEIGIEPTQSIHIIDMELEALSCANEQRLIDELDSLLHRFTDKDKKLDDKERDDAIQMVCRPKPGYTKGLAFDIAGQRIDNFCRAHGVKIKKGFFRWALP